MYLFLFQRRVSGTAVDQNVGRYGKTTKLVSVFITGIVIVGFVLWRTNSLPLSK
jgi:hypothetical protein